MPSNLEFINAIFGPDSLYCHVTDFIHDPSNIPKNQHLTAWKGDYFSRHQFRENSNQYFTISTFHADENGVARRRKALYKQTHCIVLDDVKEKLSMNEVSRLPSPSWILETSTGSEQWGYILDTPCSDRARAENLLDGLVANGLAPDGKDPGMKGVTRYVRLPDGVNNKSSKLVNGLPFKCRMLSWNPEIKVAIETLAEPFNVDLDAPRREARVDGAADISNHPLVNCSDLIHIKEVRSAGRYDITCPWVDEHTGGDDSGTAVFTNQDGTIGFKCHHGACGNRTGNDLLDHLNRESPGFRQNLSHWQLVNTFADVSKVSFLDAPVVSAATEEVDILPGLIDKLSRTPVGSEESIDLASKLLKHIESFSEARKLTIHNRVRDIMNWSKRDFETIIKDLRSGWYEASQSDVSFFDETIYVAEQNQFFNRRKRMWYTPEAYQNSFSHLDADARKSALQGNKSTKVDRVDYAPKKPPVFEDDGVLYGNSWHNENELPGIEGDVSVWLDHFDTLGWGEYRNHVLKWMAWTILHPDVKINHMILLGSGEGCGKDWLMYPLVQAMGTNHMTISGEELLEGFNDYVLSTKHLHVNEAELGDRNEAYAVSGKLKPLAAAPPDKLRVNQKGIKKIEVRNLLSVSMTTNSQTPIRLTGHSRRIFAMWSDLQTRDGFGNMKEEWRSFWGDAWEWMKAGGWQHCVWYLRNRVDLEGWNPGEAPPVTTFLQDIVDASRSPLQQTLQRLIMTKFGVFRCDLATTDDIVSTVRSAITFGNDLSATGSVPAPNKIGPALKEMGAHYRVDSKVGNDHASIWVIRNHEKWRWSSPDDLLNEYNNMIKDYKQSNQLGVVK